MTDFSLTTNSLGVQLKGMMTFMLIFLATNYPLVWSAPPQTPTMTNDCSELSICSHPAYTSNYKLRYEEGKSYVYDFETESIINMSDNNTDENSQLRVTGQAILSPLSPCELLLTIRQASVESGRATTKIDPGQLQGSSVRFTLEEGKIDNFCVSKGDTTWSINFKRGLVSTFQNLALQNPPIDGGPPSSFYETDLMGRCKINYTLTEGNVYTKTRKLESCTNRDFGPALTYGVPYSDSTMDKHTIDLDMTLTCTQTLDNLIFSKISCKESINPSLGYKNESPLVIKTFLNLTAITDEDSPNSLSKSATQISSSILFDYGYTPEENSEETIDRQKMATSLNLLQKICLEMAVSDDPKNDPTVVGVISSKLPGTFLQLKKSIGVSSTPLQDLQFLLRKIRGGLCRKDGGSQKLEKLFLDALAMSATDGAIALLSDLYAQNELSWTTKSNFHSHTRFALRPGPQAIGAMVNLLDGQKNEPDLLSTAAGLAHRFCKERNPHCYHDDDYIKLVNLVGHDAQKNCSLTSLEALGNLDYLTPQTVSTILKCLDDQSESIQIVAMDSFRGQPCQPKIREKVKGILAEKNSKYSDTIKIRAYLALTKCLQTGDVEVIKEVIMEERSKQVSFFMATHIRTILRASGPGLGQQKLILGDLEKLASASKQGSPINDDLDRSESVQFSHFNDQDNIGFLLDLNRIHYAGSKLPKMVSLNFTVHLMGRSYNLIEMGLYLANFESLLNSFLGPLALLDLMDSVRSGSVQEIIDDYNGENSEIIDTFSSNFSLNLDQEFDRIYGTKVVTAISSPPNQKESSHFFLRFFGTTVIFDEPKFENWSLTSVAMPVVNFLNKLLDQGLTQNYPSVGVKKEGQKNKIDLINPILLLDEELSLATISGFPLKINLAASTIFSMHLKGHSDIGHFLAQPAAGQQELGEVPVKSKFAYGSSTLLKFRVSMGSGVIENGFQVEEKVYSTASIEGQIKRQKGQLDVMVNFPQQKTPLLDGRHDIYWIEELGGDTGLEKKFPVKFFENFQKTTYDDCSSVDEFWGPLKTCATFKVPKNREDFLNGPAAISVTLEKTDEKMEGYHLQIMSQLEDENQKLFSTTFDIPGTNGSHKRGMKWTYQTEPTVKMEFSFEEPGEIYRVFYETMDTGFLKAVNFGIGPQDKMHGLKMELKMSPSTDKYFGGLICEPLIQYTCPCGSIQNYLEGKVTGIEDPLKDVHVDLKIDGGRQFLGLQTKIVADIKVRSRLLEDIDHLQILEETKRDHPMWKVTKIGAKNDLKSTEDTYDLVGTVTLGPAQLGPTVSIESKISQVVGKRLGLMTKIKSSKSNRLTSSRNMFELDLNWHGRIDELTGAFVHKFVLVNTLNEKDELMRVTQNNLWDAKFCGDDDGPCQLFNRFQVLMPSNDLDFSLKEDYIKLNKSEIIDFNIGYHPGYAAAFKIETGQPKIIYQLEGKLKYPEKSLEFLDKAQKLGDDYGSRHITTIEVTPGPKLLAVTDLIMRGDNWFDDDNAENSISSTITSPPSSQPIMLFKAGSIHKSGLTSAHLLLASMRSKEIDILAEYKKKKGEDDPNLINVKALLLNRVHASLTGSHFPNQTNLKLTGHWLRNGGNFEAETGLKLEEENIYKLDGQVRWTTKNLEDNPAENVRTPINSSSSSENGQSLSTMSSSSAITFKGNFPLNLLNGSQTLFVGYGAYPNQLGLLVTNKMETIDEEITSKLNIKVDPLPYELSWENRVGGGTSNFDKKKIFSNLKLNLGQLPMLNALVKLNDSIIDQGGEKFTQLYDGLLALDGLFIGPSLRYGYKVAWIPDKIINTVISTREGSRQASSSFQVGAKLDQLASCQQIELGYKLSQPSSRIGVMKGVFNVTVPFYI